MVFSGGQPADGLYFVGKGAVDILSTPADVSPTSPHRGEEAGGDGPPVVCRLTEGMFFGAICDDFYQVSALIPYEAHHDTIIFALTTADLPALHAYYDGLQDAGHKARVKRALTTLLRRFQSEADYKAALTPVPTPLSSRGGSDRQLAGPPSPKRLRELIRTVSRSVKHSRANTVTQAHDLLRTDDDDTGAESDQPPESKADPPPPPPPPGPPAPAPTIITISRATEATPLITTTPPHSYTDPSQTVPAPPPPLSAPGPAPRALPLQRASTDTEPEVRRSSFTQTLSSFIAPQQGEGHRAHSQSLDGDAIPIIDAPPAPPPRQRAGSAMAARLSPEPQGSRRASVAPFAFLRRFGEAKEGGGGGGREAGGGGPSSPLSINTRLGEGQAAHQRQPSGGAVTPTPASGGSEASHSPRSPRRAPLSPLLGTRGEGGGGGLGGVSGRTLYLEKALSALSNEELVLLLNKATLKLYVRSQQHAHGATGEERAGAVGGGQVSR